MTSSYARPTPGYVPQTGYDNSKPKGRVVVVQDPNTGQGRTIWVSDDDPNRAALIAQGEAWAKKQHDDYAGANKLPMGGGYQGSTYGAATPDTRPWWQKATIPEIMAIIKQNPAMAKVIPAEIKNQQFPNQYFLDNPSEQAMLTPERRATFGVGALGAPRARNLGPNADFIAKNATKAAAPAGVPTRDADANWIQPGANGPSEMSPSGLNAPLTPRIRDAIAGKPQASLRTLGNLPFFSAQSLANMPGSERTVLAGLANRTGNRADDFFEESARRSAMPHGGGGGVSGAPRPRY